MVMIQQNCLTSNLGTTYKTEKRKYIRTQLLLNYYRNINNNLRVHVKRVLEPLD